MNDNHIKVERHRIKIPIFGWLRIKEFGYLPNRYKILSGNVSREGNKYFVSIRCEFEGGIIDLGKKTGGIGVDLGIEKLATVSDGRVFENFNKINKKLIKLEKRIKHLNKELSRRLKRKKTNKEKLEEIREKEIYKKWYKSLSKEEKEKIKKEKKEQARLEKERRKESSYFFNNKKLNKKESVNKKVNKSKNVIKTILALRETYRKISFIRTGNVKLIVDSLVKKNPQFIVTEDLNIKGLAKNKHLSKAILNCKWGYFLEYLKYKCEKFGIVYKKADRFFPSSKKCSNCGNIKKDLKLSDRIYHCDNCGLEINRDYNAALNLCTVG